MSTHRRRYIYGSFVAIALLMLAGGIAFALTQIERPVPGQVNVTLVAAEGIQIYLDEELTQEADILDFGDLNVDIFGTVESQDSVPVWILNESFSTIELSLQDDFDDADVVFDGDGTPVLENGGVLAAELSLHFEGEPGDGLSNFTVFFQAEGPIDPQPSSAHITMAIAQVTEQFGDFPVRPYSTSPGVSSMGYHDHLLVHDGEDPLAPWAAESWAINEAGSLLTLEIREGIHFNTPAQFGSADYGELTAHDVAWNMNRQNAVVNPEIGAGLGAQLGATFGEAIVNSDYTVEVPLVTDVFWGIPISEFDINDTSVILESKEAYETEGAEAVNLVPVGSGPFTIGEWTPNDQGTVEAVPDHWIETANISTFTVVQVPETSTRIALMSSGQAHLGEVDFGQITELPNHALEFLPTMTDADTMTVSVIWPGNLWTDVDAETEEALEPWTSSVYEEDYPWLGNPWCELGKPCQYTDTDNPVGISDMEQARLVRWALSMAIGRQDIVDELQGGMGTPIYLELMGPEFPGWNADRFVTKATNDANHDKYGGNDWPGYDVDSPIPGEEWPWEIPTNLARAEELLDLAGYPRVGDDPRFEINLNKYRCETGEVCLEQADAVAAAWESIGVSTVLLTENYGAVVVPRMRDREQAWPVVKNCSVETANYPLDWPPPPSDSTFSRPAWGCSFENKFLDYMYININGERDKADREELHLDMVDYYYYWQLYSGMAQVPRGVASNPTTIESWDSRSTAAGFWGGPQHIVPKN